MDKVKVAVRVRPFNRREIELGTKVVIDMEDMQTMLYHPSASNKESEGSKKEPKIFAFDHCFWSIDDNNIKFASQEKVFNFLGNDILERAFEGYNACIFAYGQTGSGKSYTMMGTQENKGIIPRLCDTLFEYIAKEADDELSFKVEVSYMEIYNEKVRDLLDPKGKHNLRVREHNILGPYVDGLSALAVSSFEDIDNLMSEGNKSRTVAATNMNSESSRSHAVFNIILTQTITDLQSGVSGEKVSKMSLVDLAGSERAQKTGAVGERLKEGSNINKSLTTLGLVISALADQSPKSKNKFVPYRDSVLTWLLKDNLGGNSKTVMVATLSPSADNYDETLSTLRYADRAKRIVNHAVVNEDPNARIIRELREEVEMLKKMLDEAQITKQDNLHERLEESEKLMRDLSKTWEEKLKETERKHQERHHTLEKMGISVQTSGIKVEHGKYFLVNLNADPSLNELLVYYLKETRTLVGRADAPREQDIQLSGLGIAPEHCILELESGDVYITPIEGARTCINGCTLHERKRAKHGDRVLWGNNHFFRINCPKHAHSPSGETPDRVDYEFAQQELMQQEMGGNDPIQEAIGAIEKQHEEDKQEALDKQRQMYERQMQMLRSQLMSPSTPSNPYVPFFDPFTKMTPTGSTPHMLPKYQQWAQEREKLFKQSLTKLKEEVVKANVMTREANFLAMEMGKHTEFSVTLQIPAANLSPNRKRGAFVSEPAILVKRKGRGSQVWSMDKFENKIFDMRDMYSERKEKGLPLMVDDEPQLEFEPHVDELEYYNNAPDEGPPECGDPFYESQENHNLIGVANIFLEALFYDVKLDYHVPIISQQGEVAGRLHIELCRLAGTLPDRSNDDLSSDGSGDSRRNSFVEIDDEQGGVAIGSTIVCRVAIKEARGLPPALSNFVFCQYGFWSHPDPNVVPPVVNQDTLQRKRNDGVCFSFDHVQEFTVHVTEEFMEHCTEGALSIEVWGHRSIGFNSQLAGWELEQVQAKSRSIMDRWSELTRKIELWVDIHELSEQGEYTPVEVLPKPEVLTGGIFQLRQGHSRRIQVQVKSLQNTGTLPIICESITHVSIGCVCARSKLQKGLDSYQEEDLNALRKKWSDALNRRRRYLDEQLQKIMNKEDKSEADAEREQSLIDQWVCLTEERNAVFVPAAGSGIPGSPADWEAPTGMEQHIPVIFLDLNAEDMSTPNVKEGLQASGMNSILPKEHGTKFYTLPFVKNTDKDVCSLVSWDSSIHDSVHLNRVTPANERVYLILKAVVRLSHPASMELVLRKRICINVYKRQSITDKLKKRIGKAVMYTVSGSDYLQDPLCSSGVTYEIVSNIPKASEDLEDRESLAQIAASQNEQNAVDGETYIEKYIRGVSALESILTLDRLRQEVSIKELLAARGRPLRKATSVPNIHNMLTSPRGLDEKVRSDSSQDLTFRRESEAFATLPKQFSLGRPGAAVDNNKDITKAGTFGLARPTFLNLRTNIYSSTKPSPKSGMSPQPAKLMPLTTLVEEQQSRIDAKPLQTLAEEQQTREMKPLLQRAESEDSDEEDEFAKLKPEPVKVVPPVLGSINPPEGSTEGVAQHMGAETNHIDSGDSDEFTEFQEFKGHDMKNSTNGFSVCTANNGRDTMSHSGTSDSLVDVPIKGFTPSMASSGYGSQAVSTQTLSSEDSTSVRSISTDDTPDIDLSLKKGESQAKGGSFEKTDSEPEGEEFAPGEEEEVLEDDHINVGSTSTSTSSSGSAPTLQHSESLIDSDVPSNLGSPLRPTPTVEFKDTIPPEDVEALEAEGKLTHGVTDNETQGAEQSADVYSEKATDELENADTSVAGVGEMNADDSQDNSSHKTNGVDGDMVEDSSVVAVVPQHEGSTAATNNHTDKTNNMASASTPTSDVKMRKSTGGGMGAEERSTRRRSWQDRTPKDPIHEESISVSPSTSAMDINKMKKSVVGVDIKKGKTRSSVGGERTGKGGPSPMKATYRPASMNVDELLDPSDTVGKEDGQDNSDNEDSMSICSFGSRADLHRLGESPVPSWIQAGEPVVVLFSQGGNKAGTVQFVGQTEFASGNWIGVELETPDGKNDGSVKGVRYFKCKARHGVFVRHDKLIMDKRRRSGKVKVVSNPLRRSTERLAPAAAPAPATSPSGKTPSFMKTTAASSARHK